MVQVFIDGSAGTTGLRIRQRLEGRADLELICLPEDLRKDPGARQAAIHRADVAFLCLPDQAAREAVALAQGADTVIIDTSTAHRTAPGWEYGFPELRGRRERIAASRRIANPGCHASGFVALVEPLVRGGLLKPHVRLTCFSLTGYSGGGKQMIGQYEDPERTGCYGAPRQYGLTQQHKHLKEMVYVCGLEQAPVFCPIVADYFSGMEVTVPVFAQDLRGTAEDVRQLYEAYYAEGLVRYAPCLDEGGMVPANALAGKDTMAVSVAGNEDRILLTACFDNLGKGASGAAIQNLNLVLGAEESRGLDL